MFKGAKQPGQCVLSPAISLFNFVIVKALYPLHPFFAEWFRLCHHLSHILLMIVEVYISFQE